MNVTVIIPTYKHEEMLLTNLTHNMPYLKGTKIIVINDDPDSIQLGYKIHTIFPKITTIQHDTNRGFASSMNSGVSYTQSPFALFLNDDVLLHNSSWNKAITLLEKDPMLFSISFAQTEKSGQIVGSNTGYWEKGLFHHTSAQSNKSRYCLWPEGGSCLVRVSLFNKLSGYDTRFNPFYWEDVDLGYRAWKNGYKVLFERSIVVEHHHETTIGSSYSGEKIKTIASRNQLFFAWKNSDNKNFSLHFSQLPALVASQLKSNKPFIRGFLYALLQLPGILLARMKYKKNWKLTDEEVVSIVKNGE